MEAKAIVAAIVAARLFGPTDQDCALKLRSSWRITDSILAATLPPCGGLDRTRGRCCRSVSSATDHCIGGGGLDGEPSTAPRRVGGSSMGVAKDELDAAPPAFADMPELALASRSVSRMIAATGRVSLLREQDVLSRSSSPASATRARASARNSSSLYMYWTVLE